MTNVFIILFRGVGGATQLPVAPLRAGLEEVGFSRVATYINSGNAIVRTGMSRSAAHETIADLCRTRFGFEKEVFLRDMTEWQALRDGNPFPEALDAPTTLHAFLLAGRPDEDGVERLRARLAASERIHVDGDRMYFHTPDGFGRSKTPPLIDRLLAMPTTARNWNTVVRLDELARIAAA